MARCEGPAELHLTEAAVMFAFAMLLFRSYPALSEVEIHPDGEHAKEFEIRRWLDANGFRLASPTAGTGYGGTCNRNGQTLKVILRSGEGMIKTIK